MTDIEAQYLSKVADTLDRIEVILEKTLNRLEGIENLLLRQL